MQITVTGTRNEGVTNERVAEQIAGAAEVLVPGVTGWENVTVTGQGDNVVVTATLATEDTITEGDWAGQEVTAAFVAEYITGAGGWWLGHDELVFPITASCS